MSNVELNAGWYADPHGRAIQRYWNGVAWTSDVVDASGQQRVEGQDGTNANSVPSASAREHGVVIQNVIQAPQPTFSLGTHPQQGKQMSTAVVLSVIFGPLGLFYASVTGGAILTAITVLTAGIGIIVTWPAAIVWSIIAVNNRNESLARQMSAAQPIHSTPYHPQAQIAPPTARQN